MHFHHGRIDCANGIGDAHGSVGVGGGIQDNSIVTVTHFLDFIDQFPFNVRLKIGNFQVGIFLLHGLKKIVERYVSVNIFFPLSEKVQVWAVYDDYLHCVNIKNNKGKPMARLYI